MDGIVIILIAVVLYLKGPLSPGELVYVSPSTPPAIEDDLTPALNPTMYHDEDAFMEVAHALNYNNPGSSFADRASL